MHTLYNRLKSDSWHSTHGRVWLTATRAQPHSLARLVHLNVASDWHDTELRSELSSRASWRNRILRALHHEVPSLLREPEAGERSGRWWRVTLHFQTDSGRNHIIPLMRRPNTDSPPNMPVTYICVQIDVTLTLLQWTLDLRTQFVREGWS
jgi:hypothetical protein